MSFLQTSQCQEKSAGWERCVSEMCPRKTRTVCVCVRSPPLSPGLRQPPAPLLAFLLLPAAKWSPGASREKNHTLISRCQKNKNGSDGENLKNSQRRRRRRRSGVYTHQSRKRRWQAGGNISLILHPGVGRWLTESARTPTTPYFFKSATSVCLPGWLCPRAGCGGQSARWWLTHPPQVLLDHWEGQSRGSQTRGGGGERLNCDLLVQILEY